MGTETGEQRASRLVDPAEVLRALPEAVLVADTAGTVLWANEAAGRLLRCPAGVLEGCRLAELLAPEERAGHAERVAQMLLAGTGPEEPPRRLRLLARDGTVLQGELSLVLSRMGSAGGPVVVATARDGRDHALAEAAVSLAGAADYEDTLRQLARLAVSELADLCLIDVRQADGSVRRMAAEHNDPGRQHLAELLRLRYPPVGTGPHPSASVMATGRSQWSATMPDEFLRATTVDEEHFALVRELGFTSYMSVPLHSEQGVLGSITLVSAGSGRRFGPRDLALAEHLAERVTAVVTAAHRHDTERRLTAELQRLLLPATLPEVAGFGLAVRYLSASTEVMAGGDFYDALRLPSGRLGLTIGDVEGHDTVAAATMGQLRSAVRALAGQVREPGAVVDALRWSWDLLGYQRLVTLLCARVDQESGEVVCASAGHPPPLHVDGAGRARLVSLVPASPLGAPGGPTADHRFVLGPGEALLLFTDGLVERRDRPLADGLARLVELFDGQVPAGADQLCDLALAAMVPGLDRQDDVAVLAVVRHAA